MTKMLENWLEAATCGYEALLTTADMQRKTTTATAALFDAQREAALALLSGRGSGHAAAPASGVRTEAMANAEQPGAE